MGLLMLRFGIRLENVDSDNAIVVSLFVNSWKLLFLWLYIEFHKYVEDMSFPLHGKQHGYFSTISYFRPNSGEHVNFLETVYIANFF